MFDPDHYVLCPMPECVEALLLDWSLSLSLDPDHVARESTLGVSVVDADASSWQVTCAGGHVLLLPGRLGCPCPDDKQDTVDCPHDPIDYDWSEDSRTFQAHDMQRLRDVLALLAEADKGSSDG